MGPGIFRCTFIHHQTTGSVELGFKKCWQLPAKKQLGDDSFFSSVTRS